MTNSPQAKSNFLPSLLLKYFLLPILIFLPGLSMAQWSYVPVPWPIIGVYLKVVNEDTVFFSSENYGKIYRTFDGAQTWDEFQTDVSDAEIHDFDFPTPEIGYAVGQNQFSLNNDNAFVFKTEDGGITWNTIQLNNVDFNATGHIAFLNADTGIVVSGTAILKTEDGGVNFTTLDNPFYGNPMIYELMCSDDGVLYVSTEYGEYTPEQTTRFSIYRSSDFGENWQEVYSNTQIDVSNTNVYLIRDIDFPTSEVGYAVGGNGRFLKSTDAGLTWNESFINPGYNLRTLSFTSADTGYINNQGGIYKTTDGGNTWTDQNVLITDVLGIQFASANVGYAFTITGIYKTTNGGEITSVSELNPTIEIRVFPNPVKDILKLRYSSEIEIRKMELMDVVGSTIRTFKNPVSSIDVSNLSAGNYFLKIETNQGHAVKKVILE